jgi:hypothetical protein
MTYKEVIRREGWEIDAGASSPAIMAKTTPYHLLMLQQQKRCWLVMDRQQAESLHDLLGHILGRDA